MEDTIKEPIIYKVPEQNLGILMERIQRLQRRAAKLNSTPIVVTEIGHEDHAAYEVRASNDDQAWAAESFKVVYLAPGEDPSHRYGRHCTFLGYYRRYHLLTVDGQAPSLNGWTFVGAIDVVRDEKHNAVGNMVRTIPGSEMPVQYRTAAPHCDHCGVGVNRRWKSTFVVQHADGSYKSVGRQCLKDFTGHQSPEAVAANAEALLSFGEMLGSAEDDNWELSGGARGVTRWKLEMILTRVASIVSRDGWKPKAFGQESTANTLLTILFTKGNQLDRLTKEYPITEHDEKTAKETIAWMISLEEKSNLSDYESNLAMIGRAGIVEQKMFGFAASAIPGYLRAVERLIESRREKTVSQHVGTLAKRQEMVLTLITYKYFDGDYGVRTMMRYHDEQGNVIVWWASGEQEMEPGTVVKVKATVKKHDEFNNVKQTIVSRLSVEEILSTPGAGVIQSETAPAEAAAAS